MLFSNVDPSPGSYYSGISKMLPSYDKVNLSTHLIQRLHQLDSNAKSVHNFRQTHVKVNNHDSQGSLINVGDSFGLTNDYPATRTQYENYQLPCNFIDERAISQKGVSSGFHRKIRKCYSNENPPPLALNSDSSTCSNHAYPIGVSMLPQSLALLHGNNKMHQSVPPHLQPLIPSSLNLNNSNSGGPPIATTSRYKTELCRPFEESGECKYGDKCQFAHGISEMRNLSRHPKYKTELCRTFHSIGFCPYGPRCHFIHNKEEAGTLVLEDDDFKNDHFLKFYQNQTRHHSLPTNLLPNLGYGNVQNFHGGSDCVIRPSALLTNGQFSLSSSQLYDSIQNTIAIAAASAALKFNNGGHAFLDSRKSLPALLPSTSGNPDIVSTLKDNQNLDAPLMPSNITDIELNMKYLNLKSDEKRFTQKVSSVTKLDENQGSAYDSGIEDSIYTNLFSSILRKHQLNNKICTLSDKSQFPLVGPGLFNGKQNGASSPDSNFSGNSDGNDEISDSADNVKSNCNMLLNPRLPIFKSFSTESY